VSEVPHPGPEADLDPDAGVTVRRLEPAQVRGREHGPVQARCEILKHEQMGAYRSLTVVAPAIAERARPGQFISIAIEDGGALLRRPFSIYQVSGHGGAGTVEIVYSIVGDGTRWLATRERHHPLDIVGPLGNGFPLPARRVPCLLVGGGYGAAPLLYLAHRLRREECRVDVIFGAGTGQRLFNAIEAKRLAASATFTTDDGSTGIQGTVTSVFDDVVDRTGTQVVYACGPMPMLAAVAQAAAARRIPCQVAVEEAMACGVGVCMTCVVPLHTDTGLRHIRACYEGPVFDGRRVAWEYEGRRLPDDEFTPADEAPEDAGMAELDAEPVNHDDSAEGPAEGPAHPAEPDDTPTAPVEPADVFDEDGADPDAADGPTTRGRLGDAADDDPGEPDAGHDPDAGTDGEDAVDEADATRKGGGDADEGDADEVVGEGRA
jgi:dihydroorotate dehydrogenase electron transfer subunit